MSAAPAWADGGGETKEGYQLVQQALGYLAADTGEDGASAAMEKIDDALTTQDQEGVDVAGLKQAQAALDAGQVEQGRALLQKSISEALSTQKPAVGEETGTTQVLGALPGPAGLSGRDWGFLAVSAVLLLAGAALAVKYRPQDNVQALRERLGPPDLRPGRHPPETSEDES